MNAGTMSSQAEDDYALVTRQRGKALADAEAAKKFGDAFNIARKAGLVNFRWNGQDFNTQTREDHVVPDYYTEITHPDGVTSVHNNELDSSLGHRAERYFHALTWPTYGNGNVTLPKHIDVQEETVDEEPIPNYEYYKKRITK